MDNKLSNIKERILYLSKYKGYTKEDFCSKIGITYGNLKGPAKNTPINSNTIANILSIFPDINPSWLILGDGDVLLADGNSKKPPDHCVSCSEKDKLIEFLQKELDIKNSTINKLIDVLHQTPERESSNEYEQKRKVG